MSKAKPSVVCYLDFLGVSEELLSLSTSHLDLYIDGFSKILENSKQYIEDILSIDELKPQDSPKISCVFNHMILSDSIIISSQAPESVESFIAYLMIMVVGRLQAEIIKHSSETLVELIESNQVSHPLLRGAISRGDHYDDYDNHIIISRALINAFIIEKNTKVPVVVVADDLVDSLKMNKTYYNKLCSDRNLINETRYVSHPFINYLNYFGAESYDEEKHIASMHWKILKKNIDIANARGQEYNSDKCEKIFSKLRWLTQYHNYYFHPASKFEELLFADAMNDTNFGQLDIVT